MASAFVYGALAVLTATLSCVPAAAQFGKKPDKQDAELGLELDCVLDRVREGKLASTGNPQHIEVAIWHGRFLPFAKDIAAMPIFRDETMALAEAGARLVANNEWPKQFMLHSYGKTYISSLMVRADQPVQSTPGRFGATLLMLDPKIEKKADGSVSGSIRAHFTGSCAVTEAQKFAVFKPKWQKQ